MKVRTLFFGVIKNRFLIKYNFLSIAGWVCCFALHVHHVYMNVYVCMYEWMNEWKAEKLEAFIITNFPFDPFQLLCEGRREMSLNINEWIPLNE